MLAGFRKMSSHASWSLPPSRSGRFDSPGDRVLLVAQRFGRMDAGGLLGRDDSHDERGDVRECADDEDLGPGYEEAAQVRGEVIAGDQEVREPEGQGDAGEDGEQGDKRRFQHEAQGDGAPLVADGAQHADLLAALHYGAEGDDPTGG